MSDFFNAPIVTKHGRNRLLTESGQAVYQFARKVQYEYDQLRTNLNSCTNNITICYDNFFSSQKLLQVANNFWQHNPDVKFKVTSCPSDEIIRRLQSGSIDIGIISNAYKRDLSDLQVAGISHSINVGVLIPTGLPLYSYGFITPERLLRYRAIVHESNLIPDMIYAWCKTKNIPRSSIILHSKNDIICAVAKGYGYTFAPMSYNSWLCDYLRVMPLYPNLAFRIQALYSPQVNHNSATGRFISYLHEAGYSS